MCEGEQRRDRRTRTARISIPNIPIRAAPWYLAVFTVITVYLAVTNTLFAVVTEQITNWKAIQYVATGEILRAGGVSLIVSPIVVEVGRLVLAEIWTERRLRKARQEGQQLQQAQWEDWNRRRLEAEAKGDPFDEPPPQLDSK